MNELLAELIKAPDIQNSEKIDVLLEQLFAEADGNAEEILALAEHLIEKRRYHAADIILKFVLQKQPQNGHAYAVLAYSTLLFNQDPILAREQYLRAYQYGYESEKSMLSLATIERFFGHTKEAEFLLQRIVSSDEAGILPWMMLISSLINRNADQEAMAASENLIKKKPERFLGYHMVFTLLLKKKEYDRAQVYLSRIENRFSSQWDYIYDYVSLLVLLKRFHDARAYLQEHDAAVKKDTENYLKLMVQIAAGLDERAQEFSFLSEIWERYQNSSAGLSLAGLALAEKNTAKALEYLDAIVKRENNDRDYYTAVYLRVSCFYLENSPLMEDEARKALEIFEKAREYDARNVYVIRYEADCYKWLGEASKSERLLSQFKKI